MGKSGEKKAKKRRAGEEKASKKRRKVDGDVAASDDAAAEPVPADGPAGDAASTADAAVQHVEAAAPAEEPASKGKKKKKKSGSREPRGRGRDFTVSIAVPGSIIANAQSSELRAYVAGQIARAAAIYRVDEVIVYQDESTSSGGGTSHGAAAPSRFNPNFFLARILQYLDTPQYLRRALIARHPDLRHAGLLNPLDAPHHVRGDQRAWYREGVVVDRPVKSGKGSLVNVGLQKVGARVRGPARPA